MRDATVQNNYEKDGNSGDSERLCSGSYGEDLSSESYSGEVVK